MKLGSVLFCYTLNMYLTIFVHWCTCNCIKRKFLFIAWIFFKSERKGNTVESGYFEVIGIKKKDFELSGYIDKESKKKIVNFRSRMSYWCMGGRGVYLISNLLPFI